MDNPVTNTRPTLHALALGRTKSLAAAASPRSPRPYRPRSTRTGWTSTGGWKMLESLKKSSARFIAAMLPNRVVYYCLMRAWRVVATNVPSCDARKLRVHSMLSIWETYHVKSARTKASRVETARSLQKVKGSGSGGSGDGGPGKGSGAERPPGHTLGPGGLREAGDLFGAKTT